MITCKLGDKEHHIDYVSARALREMQPALEAYGQINAAIAAVAKGEALPESQLGMADAMDHMIRWFCILFGNQFTPDMVLDLYPADRIMHDMLMAIMAVQTGTTEVLEGFPTTAAAKKA
jgi:hypothetical protein